ncbi:MAG: hypothetical protein ACTHOC_00820 [Luteimonas sp.]
MIGEAMYGLALRLHPRAFREQWGDAMRQAFRDRCREVARGERNVLAVFAEALPDLAASAAREQVQVAAIAPPLRRHVAFALLLGFAATLWWRQPIAQALVFSGEAASERWQDYRQERDEAAARSYWDAAARDLQASANRGRHGAAALAWMAAGDAGRAGGALRAGIAEGDPAAAWLAAVGCRRPDACGTALDALDVDGALARQEASEPGNAAPALFAFERAMAAGDAAVADAAFDLAARADRFRAHDDALIKTLLAATEGKPAPARLRDALGIDATGEAAGELALTAWLRMPQPQFEALRTRCRPGAGDPDGARCIAIARLLAASAQPMARATGQRLLCRFLCDGPGRAEVVALAADRQWLLDHQRFSDPAWRAALVRAWRADDVHGEADAFRRVIRETGLPATAPAGYAIQPGVLDPAR